MEYTAEQYLERIENKNAKHNNCYTRKELIRFAEKYAKAITVKPCCTQLKGEYPLTFNEWIEYSGYKNYGCYDYRKNDEIFTRDMLAEKYKTYNETF